ncbi:MAG: chitobiase/beta-hexosaminidase C-terminal domain-containing protein [Phycisphaerales bacterium]|nr:chitobiase/beta-hexosaminidase C-terminal domain-containing protein [Phycisphaerales bacterium]
MFRLLAPTLLLVPTFAVHAQNLIQNGGFENPQLAPGSWEYRDAVPGWRLDGPWLFEIQNQLFGPSAEGEQCAELGSDGPSTIYQDIATLPGRRYLVSFAYAARPNLAADNTMNVVWNGLTIAQLQRSGLTDATIAWTRHQYEVTATGPTARIEFYKLNSDEVNGALLDDVRVEDLSLTRQVIFQPPAGQYRDYQSVIVTSATPGATIYYTIDGSDPTVAGQAVPSGSAIPVTQTGTTIRAVAASAGLATSGQSSATYTLRATRPVIVPPYARVPTDVAISSQTPGAECYYTINDEAPGDAGGILYTAPIHIQGPSRVLAVARKPGMLASELASGYFFEGDFTTVPLNDATLSGFGQRVDLDLDLDGVPDAGFTTGYAVPLFTGSYFFARVAAIGGYWPPSTALTRFAPSLLTFRGPVFSSRAAYNDVTIATDFRAASASTVSFPVFTDGYVGFVLPNGRAGWVRLSNPTGTLTGFILHDVTLATEPGDRLAGVTSADPCPPAFLESPQSISVNAGASAEFSVRAYNPGVTYRWLHNGVPIQQETPQGRVLGAAGPRLIIRSLRASDAGDYTCEITRPGCAQAESAGATLTVIAPCQTVTGRVLDLAGVTPLPPAVFSRGPGLTVEAWVNAGDGLEDGSSWLRMTAPGWTPDTLSFNQGGAVQFDQWRILGLVRADSGLGTGRWTHVAYVLSPPQAHIYLNGRLADAWQGFAFPFVPGPYAIELGGCNALIDELRIWSIARTGDQVRAGMNTPIDPATPGLAALYRFDDTDGVLHDATPNGFDAPLSADANLLPVAGCCPADIGGAGGQSGPDGTLDANDFVAFINAFFGNDLLADRGSAGGYPLPDGRLNNNDFVVFIDQFFDGCP